MSLIGASQQTDKILAVILACGGSRRLQGRQLGLDTREERGLRIEAVGHVCRVEQMRINCTHIVRDRAVGMP